MFLLKYGRKEITKKKQTETPTKDSNLIFFYYAQSTGMVLSGRTPKNPKTKIKKNNSVLLFFYLSFEKGTGTENLHCFMVSN